MPSPLYSARLEQSKAELVDDYQERNDIQDQSKTVRRLVTIGLQAEGYDVDAQRAPRESAPLPTLRNALLYMTLIYAAFGTLIPGHAPLIDVATVTAIAWVALRLAREDHRTAWAELTHRLRQLRVREAGP